MAASPTSKSKNPFYWFDVFIVTALLVTLVGVGYTVLQCANN